MQVPTLQFPSLQHFKTMTGPFGMYQHGEGLTPRLSEGYCTDDNARAVQVLIEMGSQAIPTDQSYDDILDRCWQFMREAQNTDGSYKNFRDIKGTWLDSIGSEDTQARVARLLAVIITQDKNTERVSQAEEMLLALLPHLEGHSFIRSVSESVLALTVLAHHPLFPQLQPTLDKIWNKVVAIWQESAKDTWPWPESEMTYANALICHGLLAGAQHYKDAPLENMLHKATAFLIKATITPKEFIPVGNTEWYAPHHEKPAVYDQQPIEAHTMFDFLLAYRAAYPSKLSFDQVAAPYLWFHGHNTQHIQMVNPITGTCFDGLNADGPNPNVGAESLLAYVRSEALLFSAPEEVQNYIQQLR